MKQLTKLIIFTLSIFFFWSCSSDKINNQAIAKHVVVIGFDALSPDGLNNATTPNFDRVMAEGAFTLQARSVLPTSSSTNWASMIMGVGPESHGITSNSWEKDNFVLPAISQSEDFLFPTIFHLIDKQIKNVEIGAIYDWVGFGRLFEKNAVDYDISPGTEDETAAAASAYIKDKNPAFTFIHFDHVDHAGHEFGHGSKEYYTSVEKADVLLGEVMTAIKASAMADETVVIISADHGGIGLGHGGETLNEAEIPFIVWGKSVKKNHKLKYPIYQYDNAAYSCICLGYKNTNGMDWETHKKNAFVGYDETDDYPTTVRVSAPVILPAVVLSKKAGGLFDNQKEVVIENPSNEGKIHYALNGNMPTKDSPLYTTPFTVTENTVVKSAVFINKKISSTVSEAFFRIKEKNYTPPIAYEVF